MQYINKNEFDNVKYVSIDMNTTYREFVYHYFKNCIVLVGSFHVFKNINEVLKNLRIHVMYKQDRESVNYYLLKHRNYLLMKRNGDIENNIPKYNKIIGYTMNKPQILNLILKIDPILNSTYEWKEEYLNFYEFKEVEELLKNWRKEIINSFILIDDKRRRSNRLIESINTRIKILMKTSLKYKNFEKLRNRIMYCINKDALPLMNTNKKTNKESGKQRESYKK